MLLTPSTAPSDGDDVEERFRLLAENAADIVTMLDSDGEATWVSPSLHRLLGWEPASWMGELRWDIVHPDDRQAVIAELTRLRQPGTTSVTTEARLQHRHGWYSWWAITAQRTTDSPESASIVVSMRDVDAAVRARQELEAERARLRATLDALLDPHVTLRAVRDTDGTVVDFLHVDANDAACRYLGRNRDAVVGATLHELFPASLADALTATLAGVLVGTDPLALDDFSFGAEVTGGDDRRYHVRAVRIGDSIWHTWRDVTPRFAARKRLQQALEQSDQRLRELEHARDVVDVDARV